uniref:gastrula zinc finger protein XlCGF7.1-like n=1 Tax=Myxine glutinosa TaxID=7769 RepID=UPI00358EAEAB
MESVKGRSGLGLVPAWLKFQCLSEESLRALVTEMGIEIFGALCARAEPAQVRVQLCALATRKFTFTMYAELCRRMETCRAGRGTGWTVAMETGRPIGDMRIKVEESDSFVPENDRGDLEDGEQKKPIKKFTCTLCSHSFTRKADLKKHKERHRQVPSDEEFKRTEYSCSTQNKSMFVSHFDIHTRKKWFTCKVCQKRFGSSTSIQRHVRIHTGERPYTCNICGKGFIQSGDCRFHKRIHTGERPYTCNVCGKGFTRSTHCRSHERIHTRERPCMCPVCAKTFLNVRSLKNHLRCHKGEPLTF